MEFLSSYRIHGALCFGAYPNEDWVSRELVVVGGVFVDSAAQTECILNASEKWIIPGLIDCHVHICGETNPEKARNYKHDEPVEQSVMRGLENALECIKAGVTTVRDMGAYERRSALVREIIAANRSVGSRILICGNLITGPSGHGWELGLEALTEDLPRLVLGEIDAGADHVKVINDPVYFSSIDLGESVRLAHDRGCALACHAYSRQAIEIAISAKVDSIEHGVGWNKDVLDQIIAVGIAIVPTSVAASDVVSQPSEALVGQYDESLSIFQGWWNDLEANVPHNIKSNVTIGVGSDSGFPPTAFGTSLWREMALLNRFGMQWRDCLHAATITNAQILRRPDLGTLAVGGQADFIVFDQNPIALGLNALKHICAVYKGGRCVWGIPLSK